MIKQEITYFKGTSIQQSYKEWAGDELIEDIEYYENSNSKTYSKYEDGEPIDYIEYWPNGYRKFALCMTELFSRIWVVVEYNEKGYKINEYDSNGGWEVITKDELGRDIALTTSTGISVRWEWNGKNYKLLSSSFPKNQPAWFMESCEVPTCVTFADETSKIMDKLFTKLNKNND